MLFALPYVIMVTWSPLLIIDMMTSRNFTHKIRKHFTIWLTGISRLIKGNFLRGKGVSYSLIHVTGELLFRYVTRDQFPFPPCPSPLVV
jgi:hypothetical protein